MSSQKVTARLRDPARLEGQHTVPSPQKQRQDKTMDQWNYSLLAWTDASSGSSSSYGLHSSESRLEELQTLN